MTTDYSSSVACYFYTVHEGTCQLSHAARTIAVNCVLLWNASVSEKTQFKIEPGMGRSIPAEDKVRCVAYPCLAQLK